MQPGQGYQFTNEKNTPADEKAKARWELFAEVDKARKRYETARESAHSARQKLRDAECEVANSAQALEKQRALLDKALALDPSDIERRCPPVAAEVKP